MNSTAPVSPKQVFDGVVLQKRSTKHEVAGEQPAEEGEEDGEGEVDDESEDIVLAAVNGNGNEDLSSLGGSNKDAHILTVSYDCHKNAKLDSQFDRKLSKRSIQIHPSRLQVSWLSPSRLT